MAISFGKGIFEEYIFYFLLYFLMYDGRVTIFQKCENSELTML